MEDVAVNSDFWRDRRVFVTGHTGFKGGWLSIWLQSMGAEVHGYSLASPTDPNLFNVASVCSELASSTIADIRDYQKLATAVEKSHPEIVFHLAAQSLVRYSYQQPVETYEVNIMGVVHLMEAVRAAGRVRSLVNVTTDKCYDNREWPWGYRENESLGGRDPYSSSKGCAELVTAAYRESFLADAGVAVATARAGNVIGGGDWAIDRLIPDFLRASDSALTLHMRSPESVRPWQHVLEPVSGYIILAERLFKDGAEFAEAWNFGSADEDAHTVEWIVNYLTHQNSNVTWNLDMSKRPHEANYLKLDSSKARSRLSWKPRWRLDTALEKTLQWHRAWREGRNMRDVTLGQIDEYLHAK